jgi:hypothetical protein
LPPELRGQDLVSDVKEATGGEKKEKEKRKKDIEERRA